MFTTIRRSLRQLVGKLGLDLAPIKNRGEEGFAGLVAIWRPARDTQLLRGVIAQVHHKRGSARFFVANQDDYIQRHHLTGTFFEVEELALITEHFRGGTFVDIGSNVGNHAVFAGKLLGAPRIIAFEPNPAASRLLEINLALNGLEAISSIRYVGLSDAAGHATIEVPTNNLGGGRLSSGTAAGDDALVLAIGDEELAGEVPSFIKIDTEGFEVQVLKGLADTLERHHPELFVEVEDGHRETVDAFLAQFGYRQCGQFSRDPGLTNFLYTVDRKQRLA